MPAPRCTHILFDFFGTLVDYSASRTEQGYPRSHELLRRWGVPLDYPGFLAAWAHRCAEFDRLSDSDDREYSMDEVAGAFLAEVLGRPPEAADVATFVSAYVTEWSTAVRYPAGIEQLLDRLAGDFRFAVVTNTHHAPLVPGHLAAMGVLDRFDTVVTSVQVGWRKPHPGIYATTLDALGIDAGAAIFVGDTYLADYQGPRQVGIEAYLIDPRRRSPVPEAARLDSVFDLPARLAAAA